MTTTTTTPTAARSMVADRLEHATGEHVWAARAVQVDTARRVIDAMVVPYGETARVTDDGGRTFYTESFQQGGARAAERVAVYGGHRTTPEGVVRGPLIGGADGAAFTDTADGLRAELTIARTAAGDEVLALAEVLGVVHVSAEYGIPRRHADGETVVRSAADPVTIDGVAVILPPHRPAFPGAVGTARSDTPDTPDPDPDTPDPDDDVRVVRAAVIAEEVRAQLSRMNVGGGVVRSGPPSPFARFTSFAELAHAARTLPDDAAGALSRSFHDTFHAWADARRTGRALADQISADNPGVMPPSWILEVFGIIAQTRPAIEATGGPRSAGSSGLDVSWPYYDGDLTALVAERPVEKTEVTSVKVSFKKGTASLRVFAGGSDISLILERRSSPSYVETYNRVMNIAYGLTTEAAYETDLFAAGTPKVFNPMAADATGAALKAFLFSSSSAVRRATGSPASVALAATDVWEHIGASEWLTAPQYGTQNVAGVGSASELTINVNGLPVTEAPYLPDGQMIVTNRAAASWLEDGPFLVTALDVAKLGRDVAIWGLGETAVFLPGGVIKTDDGVPLAASKTK